MVDVFTLVTVPMEWSKILPESLDLGPKEIRRIEFGKNVLVFVQNKTHSEYGFVKMGQIYYLLSMDMNIKFKYKVILK